MALKTIAKSELSTSLDFLLLDHGQPAAPNDWADSYDDVGNPMASMAASEFVFARTPWGDAHGNQIDFAPDP